MKCLYVAWRGGDDTNGQWGPVGRLDYKDGFYRFCYTQGAKTLPGFVPFYEMPKLEDIYESSELPPLFANRLFPKSRPEYKQFLTWGGFDPDNPPEPLAFLGVTLGIRQTDSVEVFPCPTPDNDGCYTNKFFLHGLRHRGPEAVERIAKLREDEPLYLSPEPDNPKDKNAVVVMTDDECVLGYVPRYLTADALYLIDECVSCIHLYVGRVNLDAPFQQRLLCVMHGCWPEGFRPCSSEAYRPIPLLPPAMALNTNED